MSLTLFMWATELLHRSSLGQLSVKCRWGCTTGEEGKECVCVCVCVMYALFMDHVSLSMALFRSLFIFSVKYFQWLCVRCASSLACLPCQEWWAWEWKTGVCEMYGSLLYLSHSLLPLSLSRPLWVSRAVFYDKGDEGREGGEQRKHRRREDDPWERATRSCKSCCLFCAFNHILRTTARWRLINNCLQLINKSFSLRKAAIRWGQEIKASNKLLKWTNAWE